MNSRCRPLPGLPPSTRHALSWPPLSSAMRLMRIMIMMIPAALLLLPLSVCCFRLVCWFVSRSLRLLLKFYAVDEVMTTAAGNRKLREILRKTFAACAPTSVPRLHSTLSSLNRDQHGQIVFAIITAGDDCQRPRLAHCGSTAFAWSVLLVGADLYLIGWHTICTKCVPAPCPSLALHFSLLAPPTASFIQLQQMFLKWNTTSHKVISKCKRTNI